MAPLNLKFIVTFCFHNNKELEEYDKRLNQCKLYQNLDCMANKADPNLRPTAQERSKNGDMGRMAAPSTRPDAKQFLKIRQA